MNNNLQDFDPLLFLGIVNLKDEERVAVSQGLLDKISRYLVVRISELLSSKNISDTSDDPEKLFVLAKARIPAFDSKIKMFLEDYKREYQLSLKK